MPAVSLWGEEDLLCSVNMRGEVEGQGRLDHTHTHTHTNLQRVQSPMTRNLLVKVKSKSLNMMYKQSVVDNKALNMWSVPFNKPRVIYMRVGGWFWGGGIAEQESLNHPMINGLRITKLALNYLPLQICGWQIGLR